MWCFFTSLLFESFSFTGFLHIYALMFIASVLSSSLSDSTSLRVLSGSSVSSLRYDSFFILTRPIFAFTMYFFRISSSWSSSSSRNGLCAWIKQGNQRTPPLTSRPLPLPPQNIENWSHTWTNLKNSAHSNSCSSCNNNKKKRQQNFKVP